ncbi:Inner membrane protein YgaP [uncultured delta proteobacterium]|uniref:Inner membrane protein YgaP n=1 Tax=uncultured delta proteobacterium TaxID=34034 RepID=A0A212IUU1_9DELT|nr:Inner membrane protein YgaP [uncultured delta proteobacterium]
MAQMIQPQQALRLVRDENAILADTREPDEYARMRIAGARLMPLSVLACLPEDEDKERPIVYFCRSGHRTKTGESLLDARGHARTYILEGGILGWKSAGLPLVVESLPLPVMRQVQLIAGGLILLFVLLGMVFSPFLWLAALVGLGLVTAGITGFCGMALVLQKMPWNRRRSSCKGS